VFDRFRRSCVLLAASAAILIVAATCSGGEPSLDVAQASLSRNENPAVTAADLTPLVDGNTAFAAGLYGVLRTQDGNLFFSPYSISVALAMTYAGAAGSTATEMASALHFDLPAGELHPAFNRLDLELAARSKVKTEDGGEPFQLSIANAIWAERTYKFLEPFLDTLALNYGAGARLVDFLHDPEGARKTINAWVSDETKDRIPELIPEGVIDAMTRLVLTNAIYFKASWLEPFDPALTEDGDFHLLSGDVVSAPMMHSGATRTLPYYEDDGVQAIELPYAGNEVAMMLILPQEGGFSDFEAGFDAAELNDIVASMQSSAVTVSLPKFEFSTDVALKPALTQLGMPEAFEPGVADFSGMDGSKDLFIQDVLHKAFVAVDEQGTEAAAATAVVVGVTSAPLEPKAFEANRPFLFLIRDRVSGTVLFVGRVVDPLQS
jgi:serine protease inhibitor